MSKDIKIRNVKLTSLKLETTEEVEGLFHLKRNTNFEIVDIKDKEFEAKVSEDLSFEPEGPFRLYLEVTGYFTSSVQYTKEELEKRKEEISAPMLSTSSLIVAFITEKVVFGPPLILPPFIEEDYDEDEYKSGECDQTNKKSGKSSKGRSEEATNG